MTTYSRKIRNQKFKELGTSGYINDIYDNWWLRTPSEDSAWEKEIGDNGSEGEGVVSFPGGIRPVIHLDLSAAGWSLIDPISSTDEPSPDPAIEEEPDDEGTGRGSGTMDSGSENQGSGNSDSGTGGSEASHTHTPVTMPAKKATCTATGLTEGEVCSECGEILKEQQIIPASGHEYGDWETRDGMKIRTCKVCGHTIREKIAQPDPVSIRNAVVTLPSAVYTGKALKPAVTVKLGSKTLKSGTDYTVAYKDNKNAGQATATTTGIGSYTGTAAKTFTIDKAKNPLKVKTTSKTYKRSALKKAKSFTIGASKGQGKVTYTLNAAAKKAKIKVTAKGKVTVPKKCRKGTYKITVKAAGNRNYNVGNKKVTIKVK